MDKVKLTVSTVIGIISAKLGTLALPVYILLFLNMADYTTGIVASYYKGEKICSRKGFRGIAKKVCMWLLIIVGAVTDKLIIYAAEFANINIGNSFAVGCGVAVWLICNEIISLLENISDIGVNIPEFLQGILTKIKEKLKGRIQ